MSEISKLNDQPIKEVVENTSARNIEMQKPDPAKMASRAKDDADFQVSAIQASNLRALGNVNLAITIDESSELPVIKIFDKDTGSELLQVPAEHSLNISKTIRAAVGAIFDKQV
jgi:uncharacterized FlaG/YvyC family protein